MKKYKKKIRDKAEQFRECDAKDVKITAPKWIEEWNRQFK